MLEFVLQLSYVLSFLNLLILRQALREYEGRTIVVLLIMTRVYGQWRKRVGMKIVEE